MTARSSRTPDRVPILVTGAHRSGTTWVGKMLAASGEVAYISEPLNVTHRPGVFSANVPYWYTYISSANEAQYLPALHQTLGLRYHAWAEMRTMHSRKDLLRMGRDWRTFITGRLRRQRPLLKDPFAVLSIPWCIQRLGCRGVVTVRHPAAFASSLKRLNWPFDLRDLLAQPLLMQDWLYPYQAEMNALIASENTHPDPEKIIDQASLLWKLVYEVVDRLRPQYPGLQVVRHEDLSLGPQAGYQTLYHALELNYTSKVEQVILASSSAENPKELSKGDVFGTRLDSRANLHNWKKRLTPEEVTRIRQWTEPVVSRYYPDLPWD